MTMRLNCFLLFAQVALLHITFGSEVVVQVNTKRWIYYVPERFLSLTVDPLTLAAASPLTKESFNMAKGLSPSFVRLGGIGTNAVYFGKKFMENSTTVSEDQWDSVNEFAKKTGLDIIASLNPTSRSEGAWDSQNSFELINYSSKKHYGVAWQLGYDMRGYNASGAEVGKDLSTLKKMLDGVTNYANSPVFGPDVTSVNGAKQIHFIKDLITNAGNPLACLILRPNFKNDDQSEDPYELMASMTNELDTYVWNKDVRIGRSIPKKPVWIAEPTASQGSFPETMKFAKRIGHAARLGVQIYLRQAGATALKTPTPDYWFSLLYKTLVGQGVLDYKIVSRNQSGLHVFTHCTAAVPQERSVLDADWDYEKGAVTLFGVNESPESTKLVLKVTNKEEPIHIYTLTSAKTNNIASNNGVVTLLNGQELKLSPTGELPVLSPKVKKPSKSSSVPIPGDSVYFVVMPDSKVRTCSIAPLSTPDLNFSELTRRLRLGPQRKLDESKEHKEEEDAPSEESVYVSFTKKRSTKESDAPQKPDIFGKTLMRTIISKLAPKKIDVKTEIDQEEMPVKYITFNENSFLNKLAESIKEDIEGDAAESSGSPANKKMTVEYKYPALASAIKTSKAEATSETLVPDPKSGEGSSAVNDGEKIHVISIQPLDSGSVDETKSLARSRRSSREEPLVDSSPKFSEPMKIIEDMVEAKKKGTPLTNEMSDIDKDLSHRDVTWKLSPDDSDKGASATPPASLDQGHEVFKTAKVEPEEDKPRNVRHTGNAKEEHEAPKPEDVKAEDSIEKNIDTLAKIVEKTEHISSVSESPQAVLVPEDVPQEKLEDLMLKAAKSNSDPEPDASPSEDNVSITSPSPLAGDSTQSDAEGAGRTDSVHMVPLPAQQQNAPLIEQPSGHKSVLPGQFNPMLVPSEPNPGTMMTEEDQNTMISQPIQVSNKVSTNIQENKAPLLVTPTYSIVTEVPVYNEKKENVIDKILTKIATEEDSALAKIPTDGLKQGMVQEVKPSQVLPVDVEGQTVLMAPEEVIALKQPDAKSSKSDGITSTLEDSGKQFDLIGESGGQDEPSVKLPRQVKIRLPLTPLSALATPKAATATLAAPIEEPPPTTPATPVTTLPAPKETKPPSANQIPQLKPPTPEELRERYKELREKMIELRQQYLEARDKRLEEFRKQVAVARTTPDAEGSIKSTIKRRETELKEWFKKFDKRESAPSQPILTPGLAKSRPRRLSMFTNDENFDMEKFFEDEPPESYNFKRSPDIAQPQQQALPSPEVHKSTKSENVGKLLIPLDPKSPQGIVYNNRIYPARLFGYIDPQHSYGEFKEPVEINGQKDLASCGRETADINTPITRERLAYVPKDAFIKEFKSDFVPVVILDPEEPTRNAARSKRSPLDRSKARPKRSATPLEKSTLADLEEKLVRVKDEIFPKISSWIKNFSEHPPWKRDLQKSSRTRRSLKDFLVTNNLRSLKYVPEVFPKAHGGLRSAPEIEDFVFQNIDRSENDIVKVAQKFSGLTGKMDESSDEPDKRSTENGYCEEIGTSGKSVIRDPFADKFKKSSSDSIDDPDPRTDSSSRGPKTEWKNRPAKSGPPKPPQNGPKTSENQGGQSNDKSDDGDGETVEETMFATIVADKIMDFFSNIKTFIGASDRR